MIFSELVTGITWLLAGIDKKNSNFNWQTLWSWSYSGISPRGKFEGYTGWEGCSFASLLGGLFRGACAQGSSGWSQGCSPSKSFVNSCFIFSTFNYWMRAPWINIIVLFCKLTSPWIKNLLSSQIRSFYLKPCLFISWVQ